MVKYKEVFPSYQYQKRALKKALKNGNGAFFFEPGLGKTKPTIDFYGIRHLEGLVNKVLIVCPISALGVWPDEIKTHLPKSIKRKVYVFEDVKSSDYKSLDKNTKILTFVITTYNVVKKLIDDVKLWSPDGIAVDESHYIKHHSSQRSKALHKLGDLIDFNKIILSGSPISKSPLNIYSQYRFLNKEIFGTRWSTFRDRYAKMGGYMGYKVIGIKNPKELAKNIKKLATSAEWGKDVEYQKPIYQIIPFDLSTKSRRIYDKMAKDAVVEFKSGRVSTAEIGAVKITRFQQITSGFLKDEEGEYIKVGSEKLKVLEDLLESLNGRKVVIFARFKWDINQIKILCKKMGLCPLVIAGGVPSKKRKIRQDKFNKQEKYKVMIMQIGSGQSIDLTSSNVSIFYSMDYSVEHYIQAKGRIRRRTQNEQCIYYFLMARKTVDYSIYNILQNNLKISELILNRYKDIIGGTLKIS